MSVALSTLDLSKGVKFDFKTWEKNVISSFDMQEYIKHLLATSAPQKDVEGILHFLMDIGRIGFGPNVQAWPGFDADIELINNTNNPVTIKVVVEKGRTALNIATKGQGKGKLNSFTSHSLGLSALFHQIFIAGDKDKSHWSEIPGITADGRTQFMATMSGFTEAHLKECYNAFAAWSARTPNVKAREDATQQKVEAAAKQTIAKRIAHPLEQCAPSIQQWLKLFMENDATGCAGYVLGAAPVVAAPSAPLAGGGGP